MEPLRINGLVIRPMACEDMARVLEIEAASFPSPWTRVMFEAESAGNPFSRSLVAMPKETAEIVAYIVYWLMFDEVHFLNLAVETRFRRRGIGGALVKLVLEEGRKHGAARALLEVRESNAAARTFYEKLGFSEASIRKNYYDRPSENAVILKRRLTEISAS